MEALLAVFNYKGNEVTFRNETGIAYVNATQMSKSFGNEKRPQFWLNNQYTNEFLSALSKARNIALQNLVIVNKGGSSPGTWMHEDAALEFSRWLAPEFAIWCNDRIKELLQTGKTSIASVDTEDMVILKAFTTLQARVETQSKQLEIANQTIQEQAPMVKYTEEVLNSDSLLTVNAIAIELGMTAISLNHKLSEMKIQYRQSGLWLLYAQYRNMGYTKTKTYPYYDSSGNPQTSMQTYWTEAGRLFIHSKVNQVFNLPRPHSFGERQASQ
jgi:phage antirepressor YoqD-like protein